MSEKFSPREDRDPTASQTPTPPPDAPSEDFDALLRSALPELPPQDVVREVTPLGGTVKLITWGLTLCSVTLNIGSLLPFLMRVSGTLLCLIGFRRLRRENGWFRACYGLAILHLALSFCLWRGLLAARRKTGQPPKAAAILALCGYTFFTRLPMDWQPDAPVSQEAEAIRRELRDLNFPEEVLRDLSEEDLLACRGAIRVIVQQKLEDLDGDALGGGPLLQHAGYAAVLGRLPDPQRPGRLPDQRPLPQPG